MACPNLSMLFCSSAFMQPLMDCAVCYKMHRGEIEPEPKPYIHCLRKPAITQVSISCFTFNTVSPKVLTVACHKWWNRTAMINMFIFTWLWMAGNDSRQTGALQYTGIQQRVNSSSGINRQRVKVLLENMQHLVSLLLKISKKLQSDR